jgi:hypothetical protein
MVGPLHSCHISSSETVNLLEIDEPVSDFSDDSAESKPDFMDNQSDNGIAEENSDEGNNSAQSS